MQATGPLATTLELDAAILQAAITCGLAVLSGFLYRRYRKSYFAWFAVAWALYVLRLGAIMGFLLTRNWSWLYWHQVLTGWTALAILWAACVFSGQTRWRRAVLALGLFPPAWSWVAIYRLDHFLWAALPAVTTGQAVAVDYDTWYLNAGLTAARSVVSDLQQALGA